MERNQYLVFIANNQHADASMLAFNSLLKTKVLHFQDQIISNAGSGFSMGLFNSKGSVGE